MPSRMGSIAQQGPAQGYWSGRKRRVANGLALAGVAGCTLAIALLPDAALAAPPVAPQTGETIQRQQQQQIDQDQTQILTSPRGQSVIDLPTHKPAVVPNGACRTITRIEFTHSPGMSGRDRQHLVAPFEGRCLGLGDVENLLSDVTRFYIDHARPTTRVYIQPQSLTQGTLVLDVVEGRVEKVILNDGGKHSVNLLGAFGYTGNIDFNLRVFEQGLDQINRLASNHATLDILPGDQPGDSIVEIRNHPTSRVHVSASYDDTGQPTTGRNQASGTIITDDLLGLNEQISYTRRQTIRTGQPNANSLSDSALIVVPFGALTMTVGYSDSAYTSQSITTDGTVFVLTGDTHTTFGEIDAAVWRNRRSKLSFSARLSNKINRNYIDNSYLAVSSRILTVLDLGSEFTTIIGAGTLKLDAGWSRGLDALGALVDAPGLGDATPHAQFNKADASAYLSLPFAIGHEHFSLTSSVEGQYAFVPVYSSEQIIVGSPFTVRGFLTGSLVNDRGVYAQNDLSVAIAQTVLGQSAQLRPHVGFDLGYVGGAVPGTPAGFLSAATAGMGLQVGRRLNVDAWVGHEVSRARLPDEGMLGFVRVTLSI